METRQKTPFFSSPFSALFVIFIFVFESSRNSFSCGPPFSPFWSVKYLNFGQKLQIRTTYHTFIEGRHPGITKNPYYGLFPEWSQKKVSAHGLIERNAVLLMNIFVLVLMLFSENHQNGWQKEERA